MASIKIKLYTSKTYKKGLHPIILQVIHNQKRKYITTGYKATKQQWNFETDLPSNAHPNSQQLRSRLRTILNDAEKALMRIEEKDKSFTIEQIMEKISGKGSNTDFFVFTSDHIRWLKDQGRSGNARAYQNLKDSFQAFFGKDSLEFGNLDFKLIEKYEGYLAGKGVTTNTISYYLRTLRAIYNRTINEGLVDPQIYPFRKYKIKSEKTSKRAISKEDMNKIRNLDLTDAPFLILARDIFMFSYYCRGINLVDIAWLLNKQVIGERLIYKRKKSGQNFNLKLTIQALDIIARYKSSDDPESFVFPIIKHNGNGQLDYFNYQRLINKHLKKIANKAEIDTTLTTYVARHSWATHAKHAGYPTAVISEGMGHTTEETTQIYLASFDTDVLDEANEIITG